MSHDLTENTFTQSILVASSAEHQAVQDGVWKQSTKMAQAAAA